MLIVICIFVAYFSGYESKFAISDEFVTQSLPYDYYSVMHYTTYYYSKNKRNTIISKNLTVSNDSLGNSDDATEFDYHHLIFLYCDGMLLCVAV